MANIVITANSTAPAGACAAIRFTTAIAPSAPTDSPAFSQPTVPVPPSTRSASSTIATTR